jgi:hypothetical protein
MSPSHPILKITLKLEQNNQKVNNYLIIIMFSDKTVFQFEQKINKK